jgi:hypothetical protein
MGKGVYKELKDSFDEMSYNHKQDGTVEGMTLWFYHIKDPKLFKRKFQDYRLWLVQVKGFWYKMVFEEYLDMPGQLGLRFTIIW